MTEFFNELITKLAGTPWLQGVVAALATFILEDPTTVGAGLLVADGKMAFCTAFFGVSAGIALGDLGLYGCGRLMGPKLAGKGPLTPERLQRAERWFQRNVVQAVVFSRFVPGMRLPTYFGAGMLKAPFWRFAATAIVASVVWTMILLTATVSVGRQILPILGRWRWPVALLALVLMILLQRRAGSGATTGSRSGPDEEPVVSFFEFWPPWLFYMPVALKWFQLAVRHRGLLLPTAANPSIEGGGFIGESKSEILDFVPVANRRWVARWISAHGGNDATTVWEAMTSAGFDFPAVAKPDVGQRGDGVRPVRDLDELKVYLESFPEGEKLIVQEFAGGGIATNSDDQPLGFSDIREAGVMWWRRPDQDQGRISSITLKSSPDVVGDGHRTLEALINLDLRAHNLARVYKNRHRAELSRVLDSGEVFPLVFAGNHCQGAVFRDGTSLLTPALTDRIEGIARSIPEFWFGRFDVRFDNLDDLLEGEDFKIIEINGASAEATHIWDASISLSEAYRVLFEQFEVLFEIGAENRLRGFNPVSLRRFLGDWQAYRKMVKRYPETS